MTAEFARNGSLYQVFFAPSQLGLVASHRDPSGTYYPIRLSEAMAARGVLAAIDGPMFSTCDAAGYSTSRCSDPRFAQVDVSEGIREPANRSESGKGITLSVKDGVAHWSRSSATLPEGDVVVQLYPSLVEGGDVVPVSTEGSNASRVWRAAVAGYPDGRLAFLVAVDSLAGFARAIAESGALWAGYTDGGGSTALGFRSQSSTPTYSRWGSSEDRPVAVFVVAHDGSSVSAEGGLSPLAKAALSGTVVIAAALAVQEAIRLDILQRMWRWTSSKMNGDRS